MSFRHAQDDWLLEMEAAAILNEHYFFDYRRRFLESYSGARREEDLRLEELNTCDSFEPVLQIMAR
jgi:hypothetical protein